MQYSEERNSYAAPYRGEEGALGVWDVRLAISKRSADLSLSLLLTYIPLRIQDKLVLAAKRSKIVSLPLVFIRSSRLSWIHLVPANKINSHKASSSGRKFCLLSHHIHLPGLGV